MEDYRRCLKCNTRIDHRPQQAKYCSKVCYNAVKTEEYRTAMKKFITEKTCQRCQVVFLPNGMRMQKFCSSACNYMFRNEKAKVVHKPKDCAQCQETFTPVRSFQLFCSLECRNTAAMFKKKFDITASDYHGLQPAMSIEEVSIKHHDSTRAEQITKEIEEQDLPLCSRCAVNRVKDPEAPYQQCEPCQKLTETEQNASSS